MDYEGIVKFFNRKSKFGFIIENKTKTEYYFHKNSLIDEIKDGDSVLFGLEEQKRGTECINVRKINDTKVS